MSYRKVISLAAVAALGIACVATEAFAAGAARGGAVAARGGYYRPGVGAAAIVGGAAIGAAAAYPYYNQQCGYYPYPRCY
jgi:hypothetical protein